MAVFCQNFLDMTETLLDYVKSFRTVHWELHLQAMEGMLKWFHAYDNTNYARHFTYSWATQQKLAQKRPEIYLEFCKGNFSERRSQGKFNKLPPDQVIERTINKEQKCHDGIIGYSTSAGTVQRSIVTSHVIISMTSRLKEQLGMEKPTSVPKDLSKTRKRSNEQAVASCYELVSSWSSSFEESTVISGLASGRAAPKEIQDDLLNASHTGNEKLEQFLLDRVESASANFHDL